MKLLTSLPNKIRKSPHLFLVFSIVLIAAWLRMFRLADTLQFLGDQGRDAIIVADIFRKADPVFIGPVTSVGNMYLGPLYYYFMLPFLFLSYPSPMGPVYAVAILGTLSVFLVYKLGKDLIGWRAGLISSFLMAFSWMAVEYSRFSWNPNPAQFVGIIMVWAVYKAIKKSIWYWYLAAVCVIVLIQLHYLSLLSVAGAGLIWLWQVYNHYKKNQLTQAWVSTMAKVISLSVITLILSITPLILFDSKHDWLNANAFYKLLVAEEAFTATDSTPTSEKIWETIRETHGRSLNILAEHALGENRTLNTLLVVSILGTLFLATKDKKSISKEGTLVVSSFLLTGIIGTAFYKHSLFVHYYAYLYPVIFLSYGITIDYWLKNKLVSIISVMFVATFLWLNINNYPFYTAPSNPNHLKNITQTILDRVAPGEKYNIVLMSDTGDIDAQNYRYFLSTTNKPPVIKEKRGEVSTLFIIDEAKASGKVTDSPIYEIVVFPNKEPNEVYSIDNGPTITVLRKTE